jgi:transcriptional regulator of acetoin/glycerol metabolism
VLFLDEIGTMPLQAQAKLLTYLDRGEVTPQGWASEPLQVPVQIVAATNADLLDEVQKGNFRADLYYRFEQHLRIPPLRERGTDDLTLLITHLLTSAFNNAEHAEGQAPVQAISRSALSRLVDHDYPGNYRELVSLLRQAVKKAQRMQDHLIRAQDIEFEKSSLPTQHAVIAIIRKYESGQDWYLLRFNPHWLQYFLIGGRFETQAQTFENALIAEMSSKLALTPAQYTFHPVNLGKELTLIQYSERDKQLKRYIFHPYSIRFKDKTWSDEKLSEHGLLWVTPEHIDHECGPKGELISRTAKELALRTGGFADREQFPLSLSRK